MNAKCLLIALCLICSQIGFAQNDLFEKYADRDSVTSVYISKAMFQMIPKISGMPVNLSNAMEKTESLQILSTEGKEVILQMRKDFTSLLTKGYEELMRIRDSGSRVTFYANMQNGQIKELLMFVDEVTEFTVIRLLGKFTLQDIQKLKESNSL